MVSFARIGVLAFVILLLTFIVATAAYAATKVGTNGSNLLFGTDRGDILYGLNGGDHLRGKQGSDELYAGAGKDEARGSRGDDYIVGGSGYDELFGIRGNDLVDAADGRRDYADCGNGPEDRASVDKEDIVKNCEFVNGKPV